MTADLSYLLNLDPKRFEPRPGRPTMKAVVTTGNGGPEKLEVRDVPVPEPAPGEVLLRVLAAGVNNTEINTRLGWYSSSVSGGTNVLADTSVSEVDDGGWDRRTPFPFIQGTDCCGEVVARADGVERPELGSAPTSTAPSRNTSASPPPRRSRSTAAGATSSSPPSPARTGRRRT